MQPAIALHHIGWFTSYNDTVSDQNIFASTLPNLSLP